MGRKQHCGYVRLELKADFSAQRSEGQLRARSGQEF